MDHGERTGSAEVFRGLHYREEPDYSGPLLEIPEPARRRIAARLALLYGEDAAPTVSGEVERIMRVHQAYATPELEEAERQVDPDQRFSERDVVLITYGDLIVSDTRSPLRTLADFAEVFFRGVITTLHILPFFPYSSDRGFSVISYTEVDPRIGTWEDISELAGGFKLMFDGVFNHCSSKSVWFRQFLAGDPDFRNFFTGFSSREAVDPDRLQLILRPRTTDVLTEVATIDGTRWVWTTFSPDQVDLNFKNPRVLLKILEILLIYVRHGVDIIRLDAITYLWCELGTTCAHLEQTHQVVKLFRDVLDVVAPHVALITETNVPHEDNITYFGDGHDEAQLVYNFALPPLVLHTFVAGDAGKLSGWAADLDPPSATTAFFNFLDSHDGVGILGARGILSDDEIGEMCAWVRANGGLVSMKADGDGGHSPYELNITWFSALNREDAGETVELQVDRFIASRAVALVLRGVPGIYLPSLFGSRNDVEAAAREGSYRSINRTAFDERRLLEAFGDPGSVPYRIAVRYVDLLEARVAEPAFHPNGPQRVLELDRRVLAVLRQAVDGSSRVLCLINVSPGRVAVDLPLAEVGLACGELSDVVSGEVLRPVNEPWSFTLAPYQVAWLKAAAPTTYHLPLNT